MRRRANVSPPATSDRDNLHPTRWAQDDLLPHNRRNISGDATSGAYAGGISLGVRRNGLCHGVIRP